jgi:hypothetical protein
VANNESITVLIVLKAASRKRMSAETATARHAAELAPSPRAAAEVTSYFATQGCTIGPVVGPSFAVSLSVKDVERILGNEHDGVFAYAPLPAKVARYVASIVRERPIDFGPVSYV